MQFDPVRSDKMDRWVHCMKKIQLGYTTEPGTSIMESQTALIRSGSICVQSLEIESEKRMADTSSLVNLLQPHKITTNTINLDAYQTKSMPMGTLLLCYARFRVPLT